MKIPMPDVLTQDNEVHSKSRNSQKPVVYYNPEFVHELSGIVA